MQQSDWGLTMIAIDEALKLATDVLDKGAEATKALLNWLDGGEPAVYTADVGSVPVKSNLHFKVSGVDDDASLAFGGLVKDFSRGNDWRGDWPARVPGRQAIVVKSVNGGGGVWGVGLEVTGPEGKLIDANPNGQDSANFNRQRIFIWTMTVE